MICKWVYIIGNSGTHCPIHFTLLDTKNFWRLSVEPELLARWPPTSPVIIHRLQNWQLSWSALIRMADQCLRTQVHQVVLRMKAGPKPTLQLLRFCVSLIVVLYFWVISFSRVFAFLVCGLLEVSRFKFRFAFFFAPWNGWGTVCPSVCMGLRIASCQSSICMFCEESMRKINEKKKCRIAFVMHFGAV